MVLAEVSIPEIVRWLAKHPLEVAALIALLSGVVKALTPKSGSKKQDSVRPTRADESDLEARVRKNFEEMMRRRAQVRPEAHVEHKAAPAKRPAPAVASEGPSRKRVDRDEQVRQEPTSTEGSRVEGPRREVARAEGPRSEGPRIEGPREGPRPAVVVVRKRASKNLEDAARAVAGNVRAASAHRHARRERARELRDVALNRTSLQRAILMREILDPPIGLRGN